MHTPTPGRRAWPFLVGWLALGLPLAALAQPAVLVRSPQRNALNAPRPTNVALTFSQAMNSATDQNLRVFSAQRGGKKAGTYTTVGNTITFNPATDFRPGEKIQVVVPPSVTSGGGQAAVKQVHEFWAAATGGSGSFTSTALTLQGSSISFVASVALGDVTGDGRPDMVTFHELNGFVTIRPGNGVGSFGAAVNRPTDTFSTYGTLADVDADGDLDLLIAHANHVGVRLNNGVGVFSAGTSVAVNFAGYTRKPIVGDIDADGDLDFVVADYNGNRVMVRLNNGAGVFSAAPDLASGDFTDGLQLGDVDNDGDLDQLVCSSNPDRLMLRRNTGSGAFGAPTTVATVPSSGLKTADVNGDGSLDLLSLNKNPMGDCYMETRINDGTGVFVLASSIHVELGNGGEELEVADFDGDGDLDVVVTGDTRQQTMLNRGNGMFETSIYDYDPALSSARVTASADIDADGDVDVVRVERGLPEARIHLNQAAITVTAVSPTRNRPAAPRASNPTITFSANVAPATADEVRVFGAQAGGKKVGAYSSATNTITFNPTADFRPGERVSVSIPRGVESTTGAPVKPHVYQFMAAATGGTGTFSSAPTLAAPGAIETTLADLNNDGILDLVITNAAAPSLDVRLGLGNGSFGAGPDLPTSVNQAELKAADIDGDGDLDLVVVVVDDNVHVFKNNGNAAFGAAVLVPVGVLPRGLEMADIDGDGDLDMLVTNVSGNTVSVRFNDGSGTFSGNTDLSVGPGNTSPQDIDAADVDGDGDLDLLVLNQGTNQLRLLLNNGAGSFALGSAVNVGTNPQVMTTGDIDGDGDADVLTSSSFNSDVNVLRNNGVGGFTTIATLASVPEATELELADVDGDGDLDFLVMGGTTALYRNIGSGTFGAPVTVVPDEYTAIAVGDLDNDGDVDFVGGTNINDDVIVRLNQDAFQVTAVSPARHDADASRGANVVLTFNKSVNSNTDERIRIWGQQRGGKKAGTYTTANSVVTFNPATNFAPGELVNVTVPGTVVSTGGELARKHVYQYTAAATGGTGTFTAAADVSVGTNPNEAALGDLDDDGDLDMVVANGAASTVSVRLNAGAGTFVAAPTVGAGAGSVDVELADLNSDGTLDLLVANRTANTVTIRPGNGDGTFGVATTVTSGTNPTNLAVGDLDGDGDLDFVTADQNVPQGASVYLNNNFAFSRTFLTAGSSPYMPLLGDVDSDGDLDLLIVNQNSLTVSVRFNNGNAGFSVQPNIVLPSGSQGGALADIDGDGDLDLLVCQGTTNTLAVQRNDGTGSFSDAGSLATGDLVQKVVPADFDGDGDFDLLIANGQSGMTGNFVRTYRNDGSGSFSAPTDITVGTNPLGLAVGDLDSDGDLDFVTPNQDDANVSVRLNDNAFTVTARAPERHTATAPTFSDVNLTLSEAINPLTAAQLRVFGSQSSGRKSGVFAGVGTSLTLTPGVAFAPGEVVSVTARASIKTVGNVKSLKPHVYQFRAKATGGSGTFTSAPDVAPGDNPLGVTTGDLNGDGNLDLMTAGFPTGQATIHLGNGDGTFFAAGSVSIGAGTRELTLADLNADGNLDLLTGNATAHSVSIRLGVGDGTFGSLTSVVIDMPVIGLETGDIDGDGDIDLLINGFNNRVHVRFNDGSGAFSGTDFVVPGVGGGLIFDSELGDVDNDGDLDMMVASVASQVVSLHRNNGAGGFSAAIPLSIAPEGPSALALGDLDHDGDLDLFVGLDEGVSVYRNDGTGSFSSLVTLATGPNLARLQVADLNGDTFLDVLATSMDNDNVAAFLNSGSGTFSALPLVSVGDFPQGVVTGDLDNDGDIDFVTANSIGDNLSVRLNNAVAGPAPTILTFTPDHGVTGTVVTLTGTNFTGTTAVTFDGVNAPGFVVNGAGTEITVSSPPATFNGVIAVTTPDGVASTATDFGVDLIISAAESIPAGDFHHITVTATGLAILGGAVEATAPVLVQTGGELADGSNVLSGAGDFTLEAGATLRLHHPQGLGATGALQLNGGLTLDVGATYIYQAVLAQVTGTNLPAEVRNLTIDNAAGVSLTQAVNIRQVLTMAGAGDFSLNGQPLTLLSDAAGTALVANPGAGKVVGDATAQVWLNNVPNAGLDYRHLSSPTKTSTVADLTTPGFTPAVNPAYNVSETPLAVKPYPNVFGFDEARFPGSPLFISGYYSPAGLGTALGVGEGYTAYIKGGLTPDFTGELSQGSVTRANLGRTGNGVKAGWQLIGNPYPSPLDWDLVAVPTGLNPSISVYKSTGVNTGVYLTRANGLGTLPNGVVPMGQAFFARVDVAPVNLTFTNAARVTTFGSAAHYRAAPDTRPAVQLTLRAAGASATETDGAVVYFQAGATAGVDRDFDGEKPAHNPGLPTLVSLSATGAELAVNGLPTTALQAATTVELLVDLPAAGAYELAVAQAVNLPAGTAAVLLDRLTGTRYDLHRQPTVPVTATAAGDVRGRFALVFGTADRAPLAATLALYPNPAHGAAHLTGAAPGGRVTVLDATGRVVLTATADAGGASKLATAALSAGVYVVRCGGATQRLVVE